MQIIKLPPILPGDLNLAAVNQQLRQGTAQLDWSAVVSAPEKYLAVLLDKLDLEKDTEAMGIEGTIADNIADAIVRIMSAAGDCFVPSNDTAGDCFVPSNDTEGDCFLPSNDTEGDCFVPSNDGGTALLSPPTPAQIGAQFEEAILNDLLGPAAGVEEEIDEMSVSARYLVGLLAPQFRRKTTEEQTEQQDELAIADKGNTEEGTTEGTTPPPNTMFPSSMGMTFCVSGKAKTIQITANWGKYERENSQINIKEDGKSKLVWKRYPIGGVCTQPLVKDKSFDWVVDVDRAPDVRVEVKIRVLDEDWLITIFLVNHQTEPAKLRDKAWLFQPQLSVTSADANYPDIFIRKPLPRSLQNLDPKIQAENQAMAMLYRHQLEFAYPKRGAQRNRAWS